MPFEPACSLWLKMIGWTGERSLKSSGRLYIRIKAAATATDTQTRPPMSHDLFKLFTSGLSGHHDGLDTHFCSVAIIACILLLMSKDCCLWTRMPKGIRPSHAAMACYRHVCRK